MKPGVLVENKRKMVKLLEALQARPENIWTEKPVNSFDHKPLETEAGKLVSELTQLCLDFNTTPNLATFIDQGTEIGIKTAGVAEIQDLETKVQALILQIPEHQDLH